MQKNFDYLGNTFQVQLLNQIIVDKEFSTTIMDVLETTYFDNKYFKIIAQMAKEYYQKIIFNYPSSIYVVDARKKFRKLRGDEVN